MIKEEIFDISHPLVSYCIELEKELSEKELELPNAHKYIIDSKEYSKLNTFNISNTNFIINDKINEFVQMAKSILESNGFKSDPTNSEHNVEIHTSNCTGTKPVISPLAIHQDDYGGTNYPVNTLIVYFNVNCLGGEIAFYQNYSKNYYFWNKKPQPNLIIQTQNPNQSSCKVVMFDGAVYHKPLDYYGGQRNLVTFQIPKLIKK